VPYEGIRRRFEDSEGEDKKKGDNERSKMKTQLLKKIDWFEKWNEYYKWDED
jgi:hypothetical protein